MYGKIIIAEAFLDRQYQTIKPCEVGEYYVLTYQVKLINLFVGGLAGGQKYIYHGTEDTNRYFNKR